MSKPSEFRTTFAENIFRQKYAQGKNDTWLALATRLVDDVCGSFQGKAEPLLLKSERDQLVQDINQMKFIPGGRYLYYAGRPFHGWNNCYLLTGEEDTREEWGNLLKRSSDSLMTGGGIGADYTVFRPKGAKLGRTGGIASGPIPLMCSVNETGRNVMQGGARRSAIYASLGWQHGDVWDFLKAKDWHNMPIGKIKKRNGEPYTIWDAKNDDFNFHAPLDMTNISVNYDNKFLKAVKSHLPDLFIANVRQALSTGEPGFSFNFGAQEKEVLRNAPVSLDTWVITNQGYKQIKEIQGKEVNLWTGKQWALATFSKTADMASIVRVHMTGDRSIKAEPSHEFLVERWVGKGKTRQLRAIEKVAASNLKRGNILHVSLPVASPAPLQPEAYTLGFLYGDGSFGEYATELTLCTKEKRECFEAMDKTYVNSVTDPDPRGYKRVYFNKSVSEGRSKSVCPVSPSHQYSASFVAGVFDADGNYEPIQGRVRLSSVNRSFLEGVQRLLDYLGIRSGLSKGGPSGYGGSDSITLSIVTDDIMLFKSLIPTVRLKIGEVCSYRDHHVRVTSITKEIPEDVYCCDVKVDEHSFCAEGVIISNCTEVCSADDSDVCNLGSLNLAAITDIFELKDVTERATRFLLCGTLRATMPYEKVALVREKNRRLGLGLMGLHEWLIRRGSSYEVTPELHTWLATYKEVSDYTAEYFADHLGVSRPVAKRAIAPTGTIGILAATTTGIEPLYAVAFKRRYLTEGHNWKYEYVVDSTADYMIKTYGVNPTSIETAASLASDPERRIKFQSDIQSYVDMSISSTINLPAWGSDLNNEDKVLPFANLLAQYAPGLRGFTCYPDGARGGQPLTVVDYGDAVKHEGVVFEENDICDITGKGGPCGL